MHAEHALYRRALRFPRKEQISKHRTGWVGQLFDLIEAAAQFSGGNPPYLVHLDNVRNVCLHSPQWPETEARGLNQVEPETEWKKQTNKKGWGGARGGLFKRTHCCVVSLVETLIRSLLKEKYTPETSFFHTEFKSFHPLSRKTLPVPSVLSEWVGSLVSYASAGKQAAGEPATRNQAAPAFPWA